MGKALCYAHHTACMDHRIQGYGSAERVAPRQYVQGFVGVRKTGMRGKGLHDIRLDVLVGEHHALGRARGAGCIDERCQPCWIDGPCPLVKGLNTHRFPQCHHLGKADHIVVITAQFIKGDDLLQSYELLPDIEDLFKVVLIRDEHDS